MKFYLITKHGKFLRKITYEKNGNIEWHTGWAKKSQLQPNPDKKSKVKFILDLCNK